MVASDICIWPLHFAYYLSRSDTSPRQLPIKESLDSEGLGAETSYETCTEVMDPRKDESLNLRIDYSPHNPFPPH